MRAPTDTVRFRAAGPRDLPELVRLENAAFSVDRFSRRVLLYLMTKARATFTVCESGGAIVGYFVILLPGHTSLGRVYSMAVDPAHQGAGLGIRLLREAEAAALSDGRAVMRLEVRTDNAPAIALYRREGYREIGSIKAYYEDGCDAIRMEKTLAGGNLPEFSRIPFYAQTLEFTCGAAALMMAMKALDPSQHLDRKLELRLWREANTIFMMAGHGGCGPVGLALAAQRRGFDAQVFVSHKGPLFIDMVRSAEKREVVQLVYEDFRREAKEVGLRVSASAPSRKQLLTAFDDGAIPLVLMSSYRLCGDRQPHWVVLTGHDTHFIYLHDPFVDQKEHRSQTDAMNIPVTHREFDRMARYGSAGLRAAVIVRRSQKAS